jgi:hypothetical protein
LRFRISRNRAGNETDSEGVVNVSLQVKNWRVFQHYKDRSPPWIKLQKSLLDDYDFQCLPLASKALAPMLWLLASESDDGSIDSNVTKLAFRLRWPEKDVRAGLTPLIQKGFLIDASDTLAGCKQVATSETETETETEGAGKPAFDPSSVTGLDPEAWRLWVEHRKAIKKPIRPHSFPDAAEALAKLGRSQLDEVKRARAGGWQGLHPDAKKSTPPEGDRFANAV